MIKVVQDVLVQNPAGDLRVRIERRREGHVITPDDHAIELAFGRGPGGGSGVLLQVTPEELREFASALNTALTLLDREE